MVLLRSIIFPPILVQLTTDHSTDRTAVPTCAEQGLVRAVSSL